MSHINRTRPRQGLQLVIRRVAGSQISHIFRRASAGSEALPSLARRVSMQQHAELNCRGNTSRSFPPLPAHVVPALRSWLAGKPAGHSLWPPERNTALMVRTDLKAAGIAPEPFDFHCLRHSYVSAIVQRGGSVKESMELARHHDADLTFGRYAHTRLADLSQVVDRLPSLWEDSSHTLPTSGVSTGLNGTTLETMKPCPEQSQVDPSGHDDQFWRLIRLSETQSHRRFA